MKYTLHITEEQAGVISDALEFWNRIGMCQLTEVVYLLRTHHEKKASHEAYDEAEKALNAIKVLLTGLNQNAYYSVSSHEISDRFRVAYDLHQVVRHRLAWDRDPKPSWNTHKDEPMRWSHKSDLARIEHDSKT